MGGYLLPDFLLCGIYLSNDIFLFLNKNCNSFKNRKKKTITGQVEMYRSSRMCSQHITQKPVFSLDQ